MVRPLASSVKTRSRRMPWASNSRSCVSKFLELSSALLTRA